jgi:flavin reductase (DIM6/NTAB) family NADH-FMN oxidoreductase RutF
MTIGWASAGRIWGRPVLLVLVRPSRYSFGLLEAHGEFTVNLPGTDLQRAVAICGSKSGRDVDKIRECGLTLGKSTNIEVPHIVECPVHYECRVIHKSNVVNADLAPDIVAASYPEGDFHRVYYGEIMGVFEEK